MANLIGDSSLSIVGFASGSHIGASFHRAALALGLDERFIELSPSKGIRNLVERAVLRLYFGKSLWTARMASLIEATLKGSSPPGSFALFAGVVSLPSATFRHLSESGVHLVGFLSDDPWNNAIVPRFDLEVLKYFSVLFTPRRANIADLQKLCPGRVEYLPFGYDPKLVQLRSDSSVESCDVLLVGGGDSDRATLLAPLCNSDLKVKLAGGYWQKYAPHRSQAVGLKDPAEVNSLSLAAKVNICAVRHANRDGHVMRTFELGALGCSILAERTDEHLEIFGSDGECVWYFQGAEDLKNKALLLCKDQHERNRLAQNVKRRIVDDGRNRYEDRLAAILRIVREERERA